MIDKHGKIALITVTVIVLLATAGCSYLNMRAGLADDNVIEQMAETVIDAVIEDKLGVDPDIDLTPDDDDPNKVYPDATE